MKREYRTVLGLMIIVVPTVLSAFTVSGHITTSGGTGISGVTVTISGSFTYQGTTLPYTVTATTNSSGYYSYGSTPPPPYSKGDGISGMVTPSKTDYTFTPSSRAFSNSPLDGSVQCDFTGTAAVKTYTISGYVRTAGGSGIGGVTMAFSNGGGSTTTSSTGYYSRTVTSGWSGTVTPSQSAYTFSPASRSYSLVLSDQSNQDYTGTLITHTISGRVTDNLNMGVSGVTITFSNGGGSVTTSGGLPTQAGYYSHQVGHGWSGTATPSLAGYHFNPASSSYSNVTADHSQNYRLCRHLAGQITTSTGLALSGVTVIFDGHSQAGASQFTYQDTVTTDGSGYYRFDTMPQDYSGNVTPLMPDHTFDPEYRYYSRITADQADQDFTFYPTVYGCVRDGNGAGINGIAIQFSNGGGAVTTLGDGTYRQGMNYGWSGTVTPSHTGSTFDPASRSITNMVLDKTGFDFVITLPQITLDGYVYRNTGDTLLTIPLPGITVRFNPGDSAVTDSGGYYSTKVSFTHADHYSGIVTGSHPDYFFEPDHYLISVATADSTLPAFWGTAKNSYHITASATGNGSVSPAGEVAVREGNNQDFIITPDSGYAVNTVQVDGKSLGSVTTHTFTEVATDHTLTASFEPVTTQHTINALAMGVGGGTLPAHIKVTPTGTIKVNEGNDITFTFTAEPFTGINSIVLKEIFVDGYAIDSLGGHRSGYPNYEYTYAFDDVTADHTIIGLFGKAGGGTTLYITATALPGGNITPAGYVLVTHGSNKSFTITPEPGHEVLNVTVNGIAQGPRDAYTFDNIQESQTITAAFTLTQTRITRAVTTGPAPSLSPDQALVDLNGVTCNGRHGLRPGIYFARQGGRCVKILILE